MQTELTVWTKKVNMATMCRTSEETDILCRSIERCVSWLFIRKKVPEVAGLTLKRKFVTALLLLCALIWFDASAQAEPAAAVPSLRISEACPDNENVWSLGFAGYLEVYNAGNASCNLKDCLLKINTKLFYLPEITVESGAYAVLVLDGKQIKSKLPKDGCSVALLTGERAVIDAVDLPPMDNAVWLREHGLSMIHSPGFPNTVQGEAAFHESVRGDIVINEVVSANFRAAGTKPRYADMIEVINAGESPVSLIEYCLSDDQHDPEQYTFPNISLAPGACFVVSCTEEKNERSTGFKISSDGETLYLSHKSNGKLQISDTMQVPKLPLDVSYGRKNGALLYFAAPTLGEPNARGYERIADAPTLSAASGYYAKPFEVRIEGEGPFFYTLDQDVPTAAGHRYTGPITISESTTLRVIAAPDGAVPSKPITAVYRFDEAEYDLPCAFVTVPNDYLKNRGDGLMMHTRERALRVPANLTVLGKGILPDFSIDCGLGISGQTSRDRKKKNFKIVFRTKFGEDALKCKLFKDADAERFESLLFRVGTTSNPIKDILGVAVGKDTMKGVLYQHYQAVNLFIGDQYYGIYYLREHIDEQFIVNWLGGDVNHVDMLYLVDQTAIGSNKDWLNLLDYCRSHDLSDQQHYDYVASQVNIDSFIDYFIWRPYTGDTDHPNIRYARSRNGKDKRWHIIIYDMDWAFTDPGIGFQKYTFKRYDEERHNNVIIHSLLQNEAFRARYLERLVFHMNHTFDKDRVLSVLDTINESLTADLPKDLMRWDSTMASWNRSLYAIREYLAKPQNDRRKFLVREIKNGLRLSDEEVQTYFGSFFP